MKNKEFWAVIPVLMLVFGVVVSGCKNDAAEGVPENKTYFYEEYRIAVEEYNSSFSSMPIGVKYDSNQIEEIKQGLQSYEGENVARESGLSESELETLLSKYGIQSSEYDRIKDSLDSVGNLILFFPDETLPSSYIIWTYIEKE